MIGLVRIIVLIAARCLDIWMYLKISVLKFLTDLPVLEESDSKDQRKRAMVSYDAETKHSSINLWRNVFPCTGLALSLLCIVTPLHSLCLEVSKWSFVAHYQLFPFLILLVRSKPP